MKLGMAQKCVVCKGREFWQLSDRRLKCKRCRSVFTPRTYPFGVRPNVLSKVVEEFLLEHSTNLIPARVEISKYKLLKLLTLLRIVMVKDLPEVFSGIVEVDETYLGGQMKNKRKEIKFKLGRNKRGFGTVKQPVFGILCRQGKVFAEIVAGVEAKDLEPLIVSRVKKGSTVCSDGWRAYTGLAARGYVHRLVNHSENRYSDKKGHHINGLEGFWGYLKRKLAAKGGIRRERMPLFLGEYVWRYNHRKFSLKEQISILKSSFLRHF